MESDLTLKVESSGPVVAWVWDHGMGASLVVLVVKNPPVNSGDVDLFLGSGRYPRGGNGNPLQYFCLVNPMDREAWWATVYSNTELDMTECLRMHTHTQNGGLAPFAEAAVLSGQGSPSPWRSVSVVGCQFCRAVRGPLYPWPCAV